jgi:hypothetical protein
VASAGAGACCAGLRRRVRDLAREAAASRAASSLSVASLARRSARNRAVLAASASRDPFAVAASFASTFVFAMACPDPRKERRVSPTWLATAWRHSIAGEHATAKGRGQSGCVWPRKGRRDRAPRREPAPKPRPRGVLRYRAHLGSCSPIIAPPHHHGEQVYGYDRLNYKL